MGALSFLNARRVNPGLKAIAQVNTKKDAVIFARRDSSITGIAELCGHSFAFGDTNATLSLLAKVHLIEAGLCGADLSRYEHLDSHAVYQEQVRRGGSQDEPDLSSHSEAIKAVLSGEFDAGAARVAAVATNLSHELIALKFFDSPPNVWVVSTVVPLEIRTALEERPSVSESRDGSARLPEFAGRPWLV